jgi:hypothetical protein
LLSFTPQQPAQLLSFLVLALRCKPRAALVA